MSKRAIAILGLCLVALTTALVVAFTSGGSSWYQRGYDYAVASYQAGSDPETAYGSVGIVNTEYSACEYVYLSVIPDTGQGTDSGGVPYNAPTVNAPESAASAWVSGCAAGLTKERG